MEHPRVWQMAQAQDEIGAAAFGKVPDGIQLQDATELVTRALRDVYDAGDGVLLHGADYAPKRQAGLAQVLDDGFTPKLGSKIEVNGRPVVYQTFEPEKIGVDAGNYQYKSGVDATGVNGRLAEVERWEATGAGKVFVHERKDGIFVVDGHQRLAVAQRLNEAGENKVNLKGYVFREADGWNVEDVRALAAQKNIDEGSGSVMDGARAIRERPEIVDDGLAGPSDDMKDMMGLARLSDEAWAAVESGAARQEHGAMVGRMVADESGHVWVLEELGRAQPKTAEEAAGLVRESLAMGQKRERPNGFNKTAGVNEPEILQPQRAVEPAAKDGLEIAERELAVMEGRLADKGQVARMWEDIAQASIEDMGMFAKQAQVMAGVVRACRL